MMLGLALSIGAFVGGGGGSGPAASAVQFDGSQSYVGSPSGDVSTARVKFAVNTMPDLTLRVIAGTDRGDATSGWLVCTEDTTSGEATVGQLSVYVAIGGVRTRVARKVLMPTDIGEPFVLHVVANGTDIRTYLDGRMLDVPVAGAGITPSTDPMLIGGREDGTNGTQATVFDLAEGTTPITAAQVATDAASSTPTFVDQTHRYVASTSVGAAWIDEVGSADLSRVGSPAVVAPPSKSVTYRGALEIWGDSIALGRETGGGSGNGWVRAFQRQLSADDGQAIRLLGHSTPSAGTKDYDIWRSAVGGEQLSTRMVTMSASLIANAPSDAMTMLAYGINDIVVGNKTEQQLKDAIVITCGMIALARPGRPIYVNNIMPVATASATAPQHAIIASYRANFAAFITYLQQSFPQVVGVDYSGVVTNADDVAQLYDGVHPTPATYQAMADIVTPIVAAHSADQVTTSWTPADASVPVKHQWIVGAAGTTLSGGKVTALADLVGVLNQTQATAALQPTYKAVDPLFGDKSTMSDAAEVNGVLLDTAINAPAIAVPITVIVVGYARLSNSSFLSTNEGTLHNLIWRTSAVAPTMQFFITGSNVTSPTNLFFGPCVVMVTDDGSVAADACKLYINDLITPVATGTTKWKSTTRLSVGRGSAGVKNLVGSLREICVFSGVLSTGDREAFAEYINQKAA